MRQFSALIFLPLFLIASPTVAQQQSFLEADAVSVDDATGDINAQGNVLVAFEDERVSGDQLVWIKSQQRILVTGNVVFTQKDGTKSYAMAMELDEAMQRWAITEIKSYLQNKTRLKAAQAARTEATRVELSGATYTACPECEDPDAEPLWQLRAQTIINDEEKQDIIYRNTRLEVLGVPVLYTPYLRHAAPAVERRSGFLAPSFTSQSDFGTGIRTPYHFALAPNYDLTLSPSFTEKEGVVLNGNWRHLTRQGSYSLDFYAHQPEGTLDKADGDHDFRGGLIGSGTFNTRGWQSSFSLNEPSDDLFFRRYQISNADVLTNRIDVSRYYEDDYLNINVRQFRNTLSNETSNTVDFILPDITYIKQLANAPLGGQMQLVNRVSYSARDLGVDVTKASTRLDWSYRYISDAGFVWNLENKAQLDAYVFDEHGPQASLPDSETETLAADSFGVTLSYPLVRRAPKSRQTLMPMAQVVLASDNDSFDRILYRTSAIYELSASNLFSLAAPEDETSRINYGVGHTLETASGLRTRFFVGQSYNLSNDNFSMSSGFTDEASAVITKAEVYYGGLSLSQNLRIDRENAQILRQSTRASFQGKRFSASADYTFLDTGQVGNRAPREELTSRLDVRISDQWRFGASRKQDLELRERIRDQAHLTYQDDCTYVQVLFDRDHRKVGTIEPETQVRLIFALRTLGGNAVDTDW